MRQCLDSMFRQHLFLSCLFICVIAQYFLFYMSIPCLSVCLMDLLVMRVDHSYIPLPLTSIIFSIDWFFEYISPPFFIVIHSPLNDQQFDWVVKSIVQRKDWAGPYFFFAACWLNQLNHTKNSIPSNYLTTISICVFLTSHLLVQR